MGRRLVEADGVAVTVCRYGPGERHPLHTDQFSRISFVLSGGYREEGAPGPICMAPGELLLKSRRALHEDVFGDEGALLVALEFQNDDPFEATGTPDLLRKRADAFALRHATAFLEAAVAGDAQSANAVGIDIVASSSERENRKTSPPRWLEQIREALESTSLASINVSDEAKKAGAHPAHVSRLFRRCYGASISEHARTHGVRRALAPLARPDVPLSEVALAAGFYDQSHMTRVFRRVTGRTPGAHRALLAAAG